MTTLERQALDMVSNRLPCDEGGICNLENLDLKSLINLMLDFHKSKLHEVSDDVIADQSYIRAKVLFNNGKTPNKVEIESELRNAMQYIRVNLTT